MLHIWREIASFWGCKLGDGGPVQQVKSASWGCSTLLEDWDVLNRSWASFGDEGGKGWNWGMFSKGALCSEFSVQGEAIFSLNIHFFSFSFLLLLQFFNIFHLLELQEQEAFTELLQSSEFYE